MTRRLARLVGGGGGALSAVRCCGRPPPAAAGQRSSSVNAGVHFAAITAELCVARDTVLPLAPSVVTSAGSLAVFPRFPALGLVSCGLL